MKIILTLFILVTSVFSYCQDTIQSNKLDSLIWEKINQYRESKGVPVFDSFEDSLMRQFTRRLASRNLSLYPTKHSDSVGYWCNAECLFTYRCSGDISFKEKVFDIMNNEFEFLAEKAVNNWINSPTHEQAISRSSYDVSNVIGLIVIDTTNKIIRFDATYHALENKKGSTSNNYIYKTAN